MNFLARRVAAVHGRVSLQFLRERVFVERAKDSKKAAPAPAKKAKKKFEKYWDPSEEPKDKLSKLIFLWGKVIEKDKVKYDLSMPWKTEAEAPQWFKELEDYEYQRNIEKLDPNVVGYRYYFKRWNKLRIKQKNTALAEKNFKVLPKWRKQTSP